MIQIRPVKDFRRIYYGIFLLSFSLLLFELTLIRVYSATLFYHFAFMAISVAMLGLAASGITVHLYSNVFTKDRIGKWAGRWGMIYGISVVGVLWLVFRIPINAYLPPDQIAGKLTIVYILSAFPFYCAGLVISGLFANLPERIGHLYAWDLAGAGLGAVAMLLLMNLAGGESAGFFIAVIGLLSAALFSMPKRGVFPMILAAAFLLLGLTNKQGEWLTIKYSKGMTLESLDVRYNKWNSFSRIMAIPFRPGTDAVYTWCPSPNYPLPIMEHLSLMIDDGAATPVLPFDGKDLSNVEYLKYDLTSFGHRLKGDGTTLIIGSGGGRDVLTGLLYGAQHIDAVDINPLIFDVMNGPLADFDGNLYRHPRVKGIVAEGRAFARRNPGKYDLLQVAMIDTWAATTAGAYSLSENTLYTVEAFEDYLNALKQDGMIAFTRFYFYPPRQALRLISLYLEAASRMGIASPDSCILVVRYESLATLMFKKQPFTLQEIARFKLDLEDLGFDLVYEPGERPDRFFRTLIEIDDRQIFYEKYPFDIRPPTDNRPFFFNMLKMKDFLRTMEMREGQRFNYYATYTLLIVLLLSIGATILTLIIPMIIRRSGINRVPGRWKLLLYFVAIGLGYIIIEVSLLQQFVLLLEHPAYAATGVIAGLLVASGLGSLVWGRTAEIHRNNLFRWAFAGIFILMVFQVTVGGAIIHNLIQLPLVLKTLFAALFIIPLGFAMGIPLPAGITAAGAGGTEAVAWCWALNGAASVVASSLAVTIAMSRGYSTALLIGLIVYMVAFMMLSMIRRSERAVVVKEVTQTD